MSDPQNHPPDPTPSPPSPSAAPASVPEPAQILEPAPPPRAVHAAPPAEPTQGRRDFFGDALREVLAPLSGLLERRITPMLTAIEQLPAEVERAAGLTDSARDPLDQPHVPRHTGLPVLPSPTLPERYLRPPGALPPGEYESVCSRCGKCAEFCPAHAIKLDKSGLIASGAPYIVPTDQPCVVCDALACMNVCPSGALKLVDKLHIRMGLARVNYQTCLRTRGDDCRVCVNACPIGASALAISPTTGRVIVKKNGCVGCGLCEQMCQTWPRSITVHPPGTRPDPLIA